LSYIYIEFKNEDYDIPINCIRNFLSGCWFGLYHRIRKT